MSYCRGYLKCRGAGGYYLLVRIGHSMVVYCVYTVSTNMYHGFLHPDANQGLPFLFIRARRTPRGSSP